jgi:hypothetical protein
LKTNRYKITQSYRKLHADIEEILFRRDPMGISSKGNKSTYDPEVETILPRLKEAQSESDVHTIIREEFIRWFGLATTAHKGDGSYEEAAREIWAAWQRFLVSNKERNKRLKSNARRAR